MRKIGEKIAFVLITVTLLALSGCVTNLPSATKDPPSASASGAVSQEAPEAPSDVEEDTEEGTAEGETFTKDFGTYIIPEGWIEIEKFSTETKFFYVVDGTEGDAMPDNISVEIGANPYAAEAHEEFRQAITNQLLMQLNGDKAELDGSGLYTANDYTLYKFTVERENDPIITTQYYIIGDYKFVLVHETARKDSEADEVAKNIVDSFLWAED